MEEQITHVLNAFANAIQEESDKKHLDTVKKMIEENDHLDITKPEMFGLLTALTLDEQKDLLARIALANMDIDASKFDELSFVYTHYDFVEQHLDRMMETYEGFACSADKTRWLIDAYVDFITTGKLPVVTEEKYWHPNLLNVDLWMNWLGTFGKLYYGNEEPYVETKQLITQKYQEKIDVKTKTLHEAFAQSSYFIHCSTEEKNGQIKTFYHFFDNTTKDKGVIIINRIAEISYTFYFEEQQRFAKFKDRDNLPDWFKTLLTLN